MLSPVSLRTRCALALLLSVLGSVALAAESPGLPPDMQAVRMHGKGGPEVLRFERAPLPQVGDGQVLIRVRAAGINPIDWKIRQWGRRAGGGQPWIPGFDAAGVIAQVGDGVERWRVGDEVMAHTSPVGGGAYAEYAVANARDIALKPRSMSFDECAERALSCPDEAPNQASSVALDAIRELAEAGKFRLNVEKAFPLQQAAEAQELNRQGRTRGKIVLRVGT